MSSYHTYLFYLLSGAFLLFRLQRSGRPAITAISPELYEQAMDFCSSIQDGFGPNLFRQIVKRDSTQYTALLGIAEIHMRMRRIEKAIPFLQRAIRVDTTRVDAPFQLAQAYRMVGRDDRARPLLKLIVARFPTFTPACMAYADVLMTDAPPSPEGALEQYEAILSIDPEMNKARAGAGASRLRLGNFQQAERDFIELLKTSPSDPYIAYLLATTRHWQRNYAGAVAAYKKSIDVLPQSSPQRRIRQWNLRLAYIAEYGAYPGDLDKQYVIFPANQPNPSPVEFTDVAASLGVDKVDRGRGVSWADLNGDGRLDLFTVGIDTPMAFSSSQIRDSRLPVNDQPWTKFMEDGLRLRPTTMATETAISMSLEMHGKEAAPTLFTKTTGKDILSIFRIRPV